MEPQFVRHVAFGLVIWATMLLSRSTGLRSCSFPAIFNFGDSNSDTGGLSAAFGQAPYPNGETFFRTPSGRYSDGRLIIDFIGSTIRPPNMTIQHGPSPISLDVQSVEFSDFQRRSQIYRKKGQAFERVLPKEDYFSQALYTFDIGQNDLTAGYRLNMTIQQVKAYVPDVLSQFSNVIKNVYNRGGRSFWIHNTGPVGCYPYVLDRFFVNPAQYNKYGCARPFNDVAQYFNQRLKEAVVQLEKDLPMAAFTYVDIYSVKYTLIKQAKKYGFEKPLVACCGRGGKYNYNLHNKCGARKIINGKEVVIAKSCNDPTTKINWDGTHFTEAANKWIFQQIVNGSFSDPPNSLEMACHRRKSKSHV